ncbi:MAG: sodium:proton antiporter [Myxococcota bacterium]
MELFQLAALLITLSALFSYLNHHTFGLPSTIGVLVIALGFSLALIALGELGLVGLGWTAWYAEIEFGPALLQGMLAFLLFAGALHVNLDDLLEQKWVVTLLATLGLSLSTVLVGVLAWLAFDALGVGLPFIHCLLFGALISPTDPIAVLAVLKQAAVPRSLAMKIAGESLFNDGVGVVIFLVLLGVAAGGHAETPAGIALLFVREAGGGILLGLGIGYLAFRLLKSVDDYEVELLLTLAVVAGGYSLAAALHLSGPLAMVSAGLLIGNHGRTLGMSERTREHLDTFWELVDSVLNAVLFLMIGLEVLVIRFSPSTLAAGLVAIPLVTAVRFASVSLPVALLRLKRSFSPHVTTILTWGGIRGGISVALALSLPPGDERELILAVTYCVVAFSIIGQGLSIGPIVRRLYPAKAA